MSSCMPYYIEIFHKGSMYKNQKLGTSQLKSNEDYCNQLNIILGKGNDDIANSPIHEGKERYDAPNPSIILHHEA